MAADLFSGNRLYNTKVLNTEAKEGEELVRLVSGSLAFTLRLRIAYIQRMWTQAQKIKTQVGLDSERYKKFLGWLLDSTADAFQGHQLYVWQNQLLTSEMEKLSKNIPDDAAAVRKEIPNPDSGRWRAFLSRFKPFNQDTVNELLQAGGSKTTLGVIFKAFFNKITEEVDGMVKKILAGVAAVILLHPTMFSFCAGSSGERKPRR